MKQIIVTREAQKSLSRMQPKRRAAIYAKFDAYALGQPVDIRKMKGKPYFRIRVGQDRIIIDDRGVIVSVIEVGPRGSIYQE